MKSKIITINYFWVSFFFAKCRSENNIGINYPILVQIKSENTLQRKFAAILKLRSF
jgi:hypothetical protein